MRNSTAAAATRAIASVRLDMHRAGRAVSVAAVVNRVCERLGVSNFSELGLGPLYLFGSLRRLCERERRLATYVNSYVANR